VSVVEPSYAVKRRNG